MWNYWNVFMSQQQILKMQCFSFCGEKQLASKDSSMCLRNPAVSSVSTHMQITDWKWKVKVSATQCLWLFVTENRQAPLSIGFSRQEYWSVKQTNKKRILEWVAVPFSRDLPNPGIKPGPPALQIDTLPFEPPGKPIPAKILPPPLFFSCIILKIWIIMHFLTTKFTFSTSLSIDKCMHK